MKVSIISLGCARNLVDSERALGLLHNKGFIIMEEMHKGLDFLVINTCGFIKDAKEESIDFIIKACEFKKESYIKHIIVCGCLVQRYISELEEKFPEVDAFCGVGFYHRFDEIIQMILNNKKPVYPHTNIAVHGMETSWNGECNRWRLTPSHYTYLKITEGCSHSCSFCVIPKIKGKFKSQKIETLINSVKKMCATNRMLSEINLIGQDISLYGKDIYQRPRLHELVERISEINNIKWIRLLYLHPNGLYPQLIEKIASNPKVCKYVDIPIQHISRKILKKMARGIEPEKIKSLIKNLRKKIPGLNLRTTLIVGFPGETDEDFEELLSFVKEFKFDKMGSFVYSREEGTPSYNFKPQVPEKIKQKRWHQLMLTQQNISMGKLKSFFGKTVKVIIDRREKDEVFVGRTQYDAPEVDGQVFVNPVRDTKALESAIEVSNGVKSKKRFVPGDYVNVKIEDTCEYDLVGSIVD